MKDKNNIVKLNFFKRFSLLIQEKIGPRIIQFLQSIFLSSYLLYGKEKSSNLTINVLFIGNKNSLNYISKILFAEGPVVKKNRKIFFSIFSKFDNNQKIDLVFFGTDRFYTNYLQKKGYIVIPQWINMTLDTSRSLEEMINNFSRGAKSDIKRINKHNFNYEVTKDWKKLDLFYNKMFLPYISKRHENEIEPFYFRYIKKMLKITSVLLIEDNGTYIAGGLIDNRGEQASLPSMGILNGDENYLIKGAAIALYYYHIVHAKNSGIKQLNFGDARPFLNDGGLQYKRKWGMKIRLSQFHFGIFGLKLLNNSKSVESFLANNPFLYIDKKKLNAIIFLKDQIKLTISDINQLYKMYNLPGISKISILNYGKLSIDEKKISASSNYKYRFKNKNFQNTNYNICEILKTKH